MTDFEFGSQAALQLNCHNAVTSLPETIQILTDIFNDVL